MENRTFFYSIFFLFFFINFSHANEVSLLLTKRQLCDLELLMNGGFAPLQGFMNQDDYNSVVEKMRLSDGTVWPMPIVLDVTQKFVQKLDKITEIVLKGPDFTTLAKLTIQDIYRPDKNKEVQFVYGTQNTEHFGVDYLFNKTKEYYIGGYITPVEMPRHYDFNELRKTPAQLKEYFKQHGIKKIVGFQTRNPMHRAHQELTFRAARETGAHLLLHPVVGATKTGDIDHFTRIKCYKKLIKHYPEGSATLSLLPLAMRMAGPREALWHAIIRKNYGCTYFIVGRDHAGPGKDSSTGKDFYDPYAAQQLVAQFADEIGITMVPFKEMVYIKNEGIYKPVNEVAKDDEVLSLSGTQLRARLRAGLPLPEWFTFPEIAQQLQLSYPSCDKKGFTVFLTGLSGAGKTTISNALADRLMELVDRPVTILDGDIIRQNLSQGLGFSKDDRSINVKRVGFVAQEITKHQGIVLCSLIAPYEADRLYNRASIESVGGYIEIYLATPLNTCEERDPKGLYAQAREGLLQGFTGISDPYEVPEKADLVIDTTNFSVEETLDIIINYLKKERYF